MDRIKELKELISKARNDYYNLESVVSDYQYDIWIDELKELDPFHEEVLAVGAEAPSDTPWQKVAHEIPMGSLNKVNSQEEFKEWASKTKSSDFLITHKIDGSSLEVVYEDGKLIRCISRGDGQIGEDITKNVVRIKTVPRTIHSKQKSVVRGEIVMLKSVFQEKYAEEYANPRNTAAGKLRDKKTQGKDCANLNFVAYTLITDSKIQTEKQQFDILKNLGFETPWFETGDANKICEEYEKIKLIRQEISYEIDGLVVRVSDLSHQAGLGEQNMRPEGQIAWKFDPASSISTVLDVIWQVGTSGRVTPVCVVEPVKIGGVTITNISLHNLSLFKDLSLFKGAKVLISRRQDVIPYIEKRID
jgi:DNA ligase (NAD+)